jgi:hypothetical protein
MLATDCIMENSEKEILVWIFLPKKPSRFELDFQRILLFV